MHNLVWEIVRSLLLSELLFELTLFSKNIYSMLDKAKKIVELVILVGTAVKTVIDAIDQSKK